MQTGSLAIGETLIDAEIASHRAVISYRPDLTVKKLVFHADGVEFQDIQLAPLKDELCDLRIQGVY
jgi:hypothetical protein